MSNSIYLAIWKRRERKYTTKYSPQVRKALHQQWRKAAKQYLETGSFDLDTSILEKVYRRIYAQVTTAEAELVIRSMKGTKDIFSAIAQLFSLSEDSLTVRFIRNLMQQYFDVYILQRLREVSETTRRQIQEAIQYGIDRGLAPKEIARYILAKSDEVNRTRAIRIARTETITAANRAQLLTHEASPFEYTKAWLPVVDDRTRESHITMNPKEFIDLWDYFQVRDKNGNIDRMIAPGDAEASVENVVNCRCVMLYKVKKDENGRPIRKNPIVR